MLYQPPKGRGPVSIERMIIEYIRSTGENPVWVRPRDISDRFGLGRGGTQRFAHFLGGRGGRYASRRKIYIEDVEDCGEYRRYLVRIRSWGA
jgi:hypothetical protein